MKCLGALESKEWYGDPRIRRYNKLSMGMRRTTRGYIIQVITHVPPPGSPVVPVRIYMLRSAHSSPRQRAPLHALSVSCGTILNVPRMHCAMKILSARKLGKNARRQCVALVRPILILFPVPRELSPRPGDAAFLDLREGSPIRFCGSNIFP